MDDYGLSNLTDSSVVEVTMRQSVALVLFALILGIGVEAQPSEKSQSWRIAFYSSRSGRDHVYVVNSDTTGLRCLTEKTEGGLSPCFSPDGSTILFLRNRTGGGIYAMDRDGRNVRRLIDGPGTERHPAWSPDGERIAFQSDSEGNPEIFITHAYSSDWIRLTNDEGDDMRPSWSPDGERIAFNTNRDGNWEIYIVGADGTGLTRLTDTPEWEMFPAWSPDGTLIAYRSGPPRTFQGDIHTIRPDGTGEQRLTNADGVEENPVWSPDGSQIVFQSMRSGNFELYIIDRSGGPWRYLTRHPAHDYWPTCAPADTSELAIEE
jgi:TolB protein